MSDPADNAERVAGMVELGARVLGDRDAALRWLRTRNHALGGESPLELLDTGSGSRQVQELLGRIEHGVFS